MKKTKKVLSVFLSIVMAFTAFSAALVQRAYAAPAAADYDALAEAIRTLRTNDANPTNAVLSVDGTSATYDDATGDMIAVAEKYYEVFSGLVPTGTINQDTSSNRTATMINNTIKNQMQSRFTSEELSGWAVVSLLDSLIANQTDINGNTNNTSAPTAPSITVTVNNTRGVLAYDSVDSLPESIVGTYTYKYPHSSASYTSGSGCSQTTNYYVKIGSVSRTTGNIIYTAPIVTLSEKIALYADYYGYSFAALVATDEETLTAVKNDLGGAYAAVAAEVYAHFFSAYNTATLLENLDAAISIQAYIGIAEALQATTAVDITDYVYEELSDFYFDMKGKLDSYNAAPAATRSFLETEGYIDMAAVDAKFEEVENAYEIAYLRDYLQPRIEADLETYASYDDDWTIATEGVEGILAAAELEIETVLGLMAGKKFANVVTVFGEIEGAETLADYIVAYNEANIQPITDNFARIREVNGYNLTFKAYQDVYNAAFAPLTLEETDAQLLAILKQRDAWYTQLQTFAEELAAYDAVLAEKIFTEAEAAMEAKIARTYAALNAILETQIGDAWAIYETQLDEQGLRITEVNLATYNTLMTSVGRINVEAYDFLDGTEHFDLSEDAIEKYEILRNIAVALRNWDPSQHLSAYAYNAETLDPIVRYVTEKDVIRDLDYVLTDEFMQELIDLLSDLVSNGGLADLGVELDLSATLDGVWDTFYTDKFVNTLMAALYPTLTELVRDKLIDLGIADYQSMIGDLDDAFEKVNAGLAPKKVGKYISASDYPAIRSALLGVTNSNSSGFMYKGEIAGDEENFLNCWTSAEARSELWREVVDDNGEAVLDGNGEPTYELIFDWGIDAAEGIDAKKEAFLRAIDAAFMALKPVFMSLLCNQAVPVTQIASMLFGLATLSLGVKANDGYNNTLAPVFEALGVHSEAIYDAKTFTSVRDIFEFGLLAPLSDLFEQLKADPVNKVLEILPTLAFVIQNNLFIDLFHNLKLDLTVNGGGCAGGIINNLVGTDGIVVDLGDELDFADLLGIETFYEDILSMDGVISILLTLLAPADEEEETAPAEGEEPVEGEEPAAPAPVLPLPHMDGAKLAMLGTDVVWADSYRSVSQVTYEGRANIHANIIANKPQVMQFLLEYIVEAIRDENFVPALLELMNKDKAEDEQIALPEMVETVLANVRASGTDAVAAVYELVHPVYRYTMPDPINWITEGTINATDYANYWTDVDAEGNETLWTKEKAMYMAEYLEDFLDDVIVMFGDRLGGAETLGEAVDYLLANLFKAETLNGLAASLKDMLGGIELPEAIAEMGLLEQIGLDLTAWDGMTFTFADGDRAAFRAGLIELFDPLAPLLSFVLAEQDISLTLLEKIDVTAVGYDGYAYGIVPLLEAFGATGLKSPDVFCEDSDNLVKNIVDPLFTVLAKIEADPLTFIEEVVPSLLYFDKVGGVQVAVEHILTAVQVLLDIIRPIYDVDIYAIVAERFGIDLHFAETDPIDFILVKIGDLIEENTDIELGIDFTAASLTSQLNFTEPIKFTSANGDDAYTIRLTEEGKADLLTRVLDFGVEQVIFEDNFEMLLALIDDLIEDDDTRAMAKGLLSIVKDADKDLADFHGVHDLTLASLFWVFFGADSVTDAASDYFYRFKDSNWYELLLVTTDQAPGYAERVLFILTEVYESEYPAFMKILEERQNLVKPPYEYTEEEREEVAGIGARFIRFFLIIINFFKKLFNR